MNEQMSIADAFWPLLNAACDGTLTDTQLDELAVCLESDPAAHQAFVDHVRLRTDLRFLFRAEKARDVGLVRVQAMLASPAPSAPPLGILGNAWNSAISYFPQDALFSYLLAAVLIGLGLLVGSLITADRPSQVARPSDTRPSPLAPCPLPEMKFVGRITGMVDCQWSDPSTTAFNGAYVPLGRKYALSSGLMEITYDTGAKVILQGPCTYEVESKTGGYLSLGKVTAKVESKAEDGGRKAEDSNPSTLAASPSPLFAVRTPTAVVTDLGTEFGVKVDEAGVTETHVFQGSVRLAGQGKSKGAAEQVLVAGQAATWETTSATPSVFESSQQRFVRTMPRNKPTASRELIGQIDYSDTWTANSPTRSGSFLMLREPDALCIEHCHGNPQRSWVFSYNSAMTTWPYDGAPIPIPWPGCRVRGSKSGFLEMECSANGACDVGFEYGLRDDFVVQFDAVQTDDRINITVGDAPATIEGDRSLSVFFRAPRKECPEIGLYTRSKLEAETGLRSGIAKPFEWHNYAVRFNLREKQLTIWVDRQCRGTINLANIRHRMESEPGSTWATLPWTGQYVTFGGRVEIGKGRVWSDSFCIGSPREIALPTTSKQPTTQLSPRRK